MTSFMNMLMGMHHLLLVSPEMEQGEVFHKDCIDPDDICVQAHIFLSPLAVDLEK